MEPRPFLDINPKSQITNNKQIPISKIPKSEFLIAKISLIGVWNLGYWDLRFVWYLLFVIWDF